MEQYSVALSRGSALKQSHNVKIPTQVRILEDGTVFRYILQKRGDGDLPYRLSDGKKKGSVLQPTAVSY